MEVVGEDIRTAATRIRDFLNLLKTRMDSRRKDKGAKKTVLDKYVQVFNSGINDPATTQKALNGFSFFLFMYRKMDRATLLEMPIGKEISYGDSKTICLEIQKYVHLNRDDTAFLDEIAAGIESIRPFCSELPTFPGVEPGSELDTFIKDIFPYIADEIKGMGISRELNADNLQKLSTSGAAQKLVEKLKELVSNGIINIERLYNQIEKAYIESDPKNKKFFETLRNIIKSANTSYVNSDEASSLLKELEEDE